MRKTLEANSPPFWLRIIIEVALFLTALFFFLSPQVFFFAFGQESTIPPDILMVNDKSCKIAPQGKDKWIATCTASYANHENYHHEPFTVTFPARKSEPRANKDVNDWLEKVRKIQAATLPIDVRKLKKEKPER